MAIAELNGQSGTNIEIHVTQNELDIIESVVQQCGFSAISKMGHFKRAFQMAEGMRILNAHITEKMMKDIMVLQGTKLGFRTDKDTSGGYSIDVVKRCFIEATMYGAYPVGNEWNIIAGNTYLTKEFYTRMLNEFPGLRYSPHPGVPAMANGGALVPYVVEWILDGKPGKLERIQHTEDGQAFDERIPVKVNGGMGADAILGKATRKMFKAVFDLLSGVQTPDGDLDDAINVTSTEAPPRKLDDLTQKLNAGKAAAAKADPAPVEREPGDDGDEGIDDTRAQDFQPDVVDTEGGEITPWDNYGMALAEAQDVTRVNGLHSKALRELCHGKEDEARAQQMADQRRAQLTSNRGERSNKPGQQKSLV